MMKWLVAGALLGPGAVIALAASPQVQQASIGTQPVGIVHNPAAIQPFVEASAQRRVDIAGIGDSNQVHAGIGHDHGVQKAWSDVRGMYATGVLPFAANNLSSWPAVGIGYTASAFGSAGFSAQMPPPEFAQYTLPAAAGFGDLSYAYLADNETLASTSSHYQLVLTPSTPFNTSDTLRWHYTYGTFPTGSGSFQPTARQEVTFNFLGSKTVNPVTGSYGLTDDNLELPAATRNFNIGFEPFVFHGSAVEGPFFAQHQRAEVVNVHKGIAYSTLLAQGGRSTRDAAQSLLGASDAALREWLRQSVRLQNGDPTLLVNIVHAGNDRNDHNPSVGPNPAVSSTAAGFADNTEAIINRLRTAWTGQGYDPTGLYFVIGAYHPQPGFTQLPAYEAAAMALADRVDNVAVVRGSKLISAHTMSAQGYYISGEDVAHLSVTGFEQFNRLAVKQLISSTQMIPGLSNVSQLSFDFDSDVLASLEPDDLLLENETTGLIVNVADLSVSYDASTDTATWTFPGLDRALLPLGQYKATLLAAGLTDSDGNPINGGTNYTFEFTAVPEPTTVALPVLFAGSAIMRRRRR